MLDFKKIVDSMKTHGFTQNKPIQLHIPDAGNMLKAAMQYFIPGDFVWLDEYRMVAEWLDNNRGLGLCLYGLNGTGKTILIQKVIPVLAFHFCQKIIKCYNYNEINNFPDIVLQKRLLSLDDIGLEEQAVIYGNRRWVFSEIMDIAEKKSNIVIFSSNLNGKGFCERYGARTFDRIVSTTKRIEFKHQSFR